MTRQQEIAEAAERYENWGTFIKGAQWADDFPNFDVSKMMKSIHDSEAELEIAREAILNIKHHIQNNKIADSAIIRDIIFKADEKLNKKDR